MVLLLNKDIDRRDLEVAKKTQTLEERPTKAHWRADC
jgi:hypothetical protein